MSWSTKRIFLLIAFSLFCTEVILGRVIFLEKLEFSRESSPLIHPVAFCVTPDELFIVPDFIAGDIKVYKKNGTSLELVNTIGRKGYGNGEFAKPSFCFYDKTGGKFCVMDLGLKKIFIYDRIKRMEFKRVKEVHCSTGATDIQLTEGRLFISGYKSDKNENPYDFYYINLTNNQITFLLPSYYKYGLKSNDEYETQYRKRLDIRTIGINAFFDIYEDDVYFVWEGDLRVIKINLKRGKVNPPFGEKASMYIKPYESDELEKGYRTGDFNILRKERAKMSYVRNIFTNSKYVLVIYEGAVKQSGRSHFWMQFYTLDGRFIKEFPIPGQSGYNMYFDKDKNILYSLSTEISRDKNVGYSILKHKILEGEVK